jgi:hypothetical protein
METADGFESAHKESPMDETLAYAISAGLVGFGIWVFVVGLSSSSPILLACAALVLVATGLMSAFGDH